MKSKKVSFSLLKIEHILLLLALISIISTLTFKYREAKNFQYLLYKIEYCKNYADKILEWSPSRKEQLIAEVKKDFSPFTFFNEDVDKSLNEFINVFEMSRDDFTETAIVEKYISLYKLLYEQQQQLNSGYICLLLISFFITIVSFFSINEKERIRKNELRILQIVNENQIKMSREIHDGIAQDLAALKISIQNKDDEKTSYFADQAFNEVRFLIENSHIELNGDFTIHIKDTLQKFEQNFGIKTECYMASDNINLLPIKYQFELLRILNEALSNVARHSHADSVILRITDTMKGLHFILSDNGIGSASFKNKQNESASHYGIENIKNRVSEMNGSVTFDFTGGTTIAISLENFIS